MKKNLLLFTLLLSLITNAQTTEHLTGSQSLYRFDKSEPVKEHGLIDKTKYRNYFGSQFVAPLSQYVSQVYNFSYTSMKWPDSCVWIVKRIKNFNYDSLVISGDTLKFAQQINDVAALSMVGLCDTVKGAISKFYSFIFYNKNYGYKLETDCTFKKVIRLHLEGDKRLALLALIKLVL